MRIEGHETRSTGRIPLKREVEVKLRDLLCLVRLGGERYSMWLSGYLIQYRHQLLYSYSTVSLSRRALSPFCTSARKPPSYSTVASSPGFFGLAWRRERYASPWQSGDTRVLIKYLKDDGEAYTANSRGTPRWGA